MTIGAGVAYTWSTPGTGAFTFQSSAQGYLTNTQTVTLTSTTTAVELCVNLAQVQVDVRNILTNVTIDVGASVTYSGVCSGSFRWNGVTTFTHCGFGSYFFFATPDSKYTTGNVTWSITSTTTLIIIYVTPLGIPVSVVDCSTNRAIASTATVTITTTTIASYRSTLTISSGASASWSYPGYGSFSFSTSATGYVTNSQSFTISASTSSVTVCVNPATLVVDVRLRDTDRSIEVGALVSYTGAASGQFRWTGLYTLQIAAYGQYTFSAIPDSTYTTGTETTQITVSTTLVIIYVDLASRCGDNHCDATETATSCPDDCVAIFFEFENADGSGPVNGPTVNYFLADPRTPNSATGPNRNSLQSTTSRTTGNGSNTVLEETYGFNIFIWAETIVSGYISFYWTVDTNDVDPSLGVFRLRVHLSELLGSTNLNYRFVNTWKPIDATPEPFGPTDLNLHAFHPTGAVDINHPNLTQSGFLIGRSVADSKQSGGPATIDMSPSAGNVVSLWNSKPPRSNVIAPSQNGRYIVDSGSYVVFYGKTSNAASGKQLGEVVMNDALDTNPSFKNNHSFDLWSIAHFTVSQAAVDQPNIVAQEHFKKATTNSAKDMIFDCEIYAYCVSFVVPYSDTGR